MERINDRYESFAYSLQKATGEPAAAIAGARRRELERRFGEEIGNKQTNRNYINKPIINNKHT